MTYATLRKHIDFIIKFGGIYSAIASFLTDFFKPVFDSTIVCAIIAALLVCVSFFIWILKFISPFFMRINENLTNKSKGFWFSSIFISSLLCFQCFFIMYVMNKNTPDGFLAEKSNTVKNLQEDFGIIRKQLDNIKNRTEEIAQDTKKIKESTDKISEYQKKTVDLLNESISPSDPKYKLNKMGLQFTSEEYAKKVLEGDLETLELFYEAGMSPNVLLPDHTNPIYTAILTQINFPRKILRQAINHGFNPNKELLINARNQLPKPLQYYINCNFEEDVNLLLKNTGINFNFPETPKPYNLGFFISLIFNTNDANTYYLIYDFNINMEKGIAFRNEILKGIKSRVERYASEYYIDSGGDIKKFNSILGQYNDELSAFNNITNTFSNPADSIFRLNETGTKNGEIKCIYQLAQCYEEGIGTKVDKKMAFKLYLEAANMGYPNAQNSIGYCYEYGDGVDKDLTKAFLYYEKAANQHFVHSQYAVGTFYLLGLGVKKNLTKAVEYLTLAANAGNEHAQVNLGLCYIYGDGVKQDTKIGIQWLEKAVAQGNEKARNLLKSLK